MKESEQQCGFHDLITTSSSGLCEGEVGIVGKAVVEGLEDWRTGGSVGSLNRSLDGVLE